jgi:hypothetical protein
VYPPTILVVLESVVSEGAMSAFPRIEEEARGLDLEGVEQPLSGDERGHPLRVVGS